MLLQNNLKQNQNLNKNKKHASRDSQIKFKIKYKILDKKFRSLGNSVFLFLCIFFGIFLC